MLTSNAVASVLPVTDAPTSTPPPTIATRFGELPYDPAETVDMPRGMPGFSEHRKFAFALLPDPNQAAFRVMQSLTDPGVSFLIAPVNASLGLFGADDLAEACAAAGTQLADLAIALVVTVRRQAEAIEISANVRAPVLIDTRTRRAVQYVLSNGALSVRHTISTVQIAEPAAAVK